MSSGPVFDNDSFFTKVTELFGVSDPTTKQQKLFNEYLALFSKTTTVKSKKTKSTSPTERNLTMTEHVGEMLKNPESYANCFNHEIEFKSDDFTQISSKLTETMKTVWTNLADETIDQICESKTIKELFDNIKTFYTTKQQQKSFLVRVLEHIKYKFEPVQKSSSSSHKEEKTEKTHVAKPRDLEKRGLDFFRKFLSYVHKNDTLHVYSEDVTPIKTYFEKHAVGGTALVKQNNLFNSSPDEVKNYYHTFFASFPVIDKEDSKNEAEIQSYFTKHQSELIAKFNEFFIEKVVMTTDDEARSPSPAPVTTKRIIAKKPAK